MSVDFEALEREYFEKLNKAVDEAYAVEMAARAAAHELKQAADTAYEAWVAAGHIKPTTPVLQHWNANDPRPTCVQQGLPYCGCREPK
jgi:hypothetical protein